MNKTALGHKAYMAFTGISADMELVRCCTFTIPVVVEVRQSILRTRQHIDVALLSVLSLQLSINSSTPEPSGMVSNSRVDRYIHSYSKNMQAPCDASNKPVLPMHEKEAVPPGDCAVAGYDAWRPLTR
jgi:hypothetical protein